MKLSFDCDRESFLADFGVPVIFGSQRTLALYDQPDGEVLNQRVQTTGYRIEYPADKLLGLTHGDVITVGVGADWEFDSQGRLVCTSSSISGTEAPQFRVLGVPKALDSGEFFEAALEKL